MRGQSHNFELVYPPISNQEAEWLKDDPEVQEILRTSKIYFIGQKPESTFEYVENVHDIILEEYKISFTYNSGSKSTNGFIDLAPILKHYKIKMSQIDNILIELGPKIIRITNSIKDQVLAWYTTEKILYNKWRNHPAVFGLDDYMDFTKYNLHYVGISKVNDSLERLLIKAHDKRLRILSNQHPLSNGSRVTDEVILFFFRISSIEFKQYPLTGDFSGFGKTELEDSVRIIADAEKAIVKIMNSEYNAEKFANYPISKDGLYKSDVQKISYAINEDLTFITEDNAIRGKYDVDGLHQKEFDYIGVDIESKEVDLIKVE